jgi:GWxTD domain-containing protein
MNNEILNVNMPSKKFSFSIFMMLLAGSIVGQTAKPKALFSYHTFRSAGKTPYIETTLMVKGNSVKHARKANGAYQASIEVLLSLSRNGEISFVDRYNLLSPENSDSTANVQNFMDQQRIPLGEGQFVLSVEIKDLGNITAESVKASDTIHIEALNDSITFSDIQLIETSEKSDKTGPFIKGGYFLMPHLSDFYPARDEKLTFYSEIYRSLEVLGENKKFLLQYFIEDAETGKQIESLGGFKRFTSAAVNTLLAELDIRNLSTGSYRLVTELRDADNELKARNSTSFLRHNPYSSIALDKIVEIVTEGSFASRYTNPDSLAEHIRCLSPIGSPRENSFAENLLKEKNLKNMQQYFLAFWKNRDAENPGKAWEKYFLEVRKVQLAFATSIRKGYTTDRGRVYLQYGPPDNRTQSLREPSAYPYEIWQYYKINNQSNRRFVFYNPDLVTNDYALIHSDALGEIMNEQWMFLVMKRDTQTNDIDALDSDPHFGSQLKQNFLMPR